MKKIFVTSFVFFSLIIIMSIFAPRAAAQGQLYGVHLLHPEEMGEAAALLKNEYNAKQWNFVTLPLPPSDFDQKGRDRWQNAFNEARKLHLAPIVRLVSEFDTETGAWKVPTRADIIRAFDFLSSLEWPTPKKFVIIYNEPNHKSEWGGQIDPAGYADVLHFAADWAHSEHLDYRILPAGMDLAAPSGATTHEAFSYLEQMLAHDPEIFSVIDYWNSHSYPNPAFSAPPTATGKNSLLGFKHELDWLEAKTGLKHRCFITETGWEYNSKTARQIARYYDYADKNIWTDERVVAVTPFILHGDPGPFAKFTLIDKDGDTTVQYEAIQDVCLANSQANTIDVVGF